MLFPSDQHLAKDRAVDCQLKRSLRLSVVVCVVVVLTAASTVIRSLRSDQLAIVEVWCCLHCLDTCLARCLPRLVCAGQRPVADVVTV